MLGLMPATRRIKKATQLFVSSTLVIYKSVQLNWGRTVSLEQTFSESTNAEPEKITRSIISVKVFDITTEQAASPVKCVDL